MRHLHLTLAPAALAALLLLAASGPLPSLASATPAEQPAGQWWPDPYGFPFGGFSPPLDWLYGPLVYFGPDYTIPYAGSPGYPYYRYGPYYGSAYGVPYYVNPRYGGYYSGSGSFGDTWYGYPGGRCLYPASAGYGGGYGSPFDPYGYGVYAPYC